MMAMRPSTAVLLAASHLALRTSLAALVGSDPRFALITLAVDEPHHIVAATSEHRPQVLLLAVNGVLAEGGKLVREVRARSPGTAVVLAGLADDIYARAAHAAGAFAYVPLERLGPDLLATLSEAAGPATTG
jgi:DNA-binding NarL/FixJ family response regulator